MIADGYTRHCRLTEGGATFNVWYRPATHGERIWFRHVAGRLSHKCASYYTHNFVQTHIVVDDFRNASYSALHLDQAHPKLFEKLLKAVQGLITDSSGQAWATVEEAWKKNLYEGVILERTNPKLARRSCESCQKWWYLANGEILLNNSTGKRETRQGPTACLTEAKCPKGTPENQKSLNAANRWAYRHFLGCQAIGSFPDDEIVKTNAEIIRRALSAPLKKKAAA